MHPAIHDQIPVIDPCGAQLGSQEAAKGAGPDLGDDRRAAAQLGDVDSHVGRRSPQVAAEGRRVSEPFALLVGDEVDDGFPDRQHIEVARRDGELRHELST